jgi:tripartite-type tricarboxylate transporter receptor subunit TctC
MKPHVVRASMLLRLFVSAALASGHAVSAQGFPSQPVRLVVGVPPGTPPDVVARSLGEAMSVVLGQPVLVENRPGAGGSLATAAVAAAAADGHTLNVSGCSGDSITHAYIAQGRPPMVLFKDLTPVGRMMRDHWLVLTPASVNATTLAAFAEHARGLPQPAAYPSQGDGSTPHVQGARLARALGFAALHVPYRESSTPDLVSGRLTFAVQGSAGVLPLVKAGRLKALAVLSQERLAALPDVPTAQEAGLPNHVFNGGVCLWAPGATPAAVLATLNSALNVALRLPAVRSRFDALGVDPTPGDLEDTVRYVTQFARESDGLRASAPGSR